MEWCSWKTTRAFFKTTSSKASKITSSRTLTSTTWLNSKTNWSSSSYRSMTPSTVKSLWVAPWLEPTPSTPSTTWSTTSSCRTTSSKPTSKRSRSMIWSSTRSSKSRSERPEASTKWYRSSTFLSGSCSTRWRANGSSWLSSTPQSHTSSGTLWTH